MPLDSLQLQQVRLGREHGLCEKQIRLYAKKKYNFLKMEQLRLSLEAGLSLRECRRIAKYCKTHREMEVCRKKRMRHEEIAYPVSLRIVLVLTLCLLCLMPAVYHKWKDDQPILLLQTTDVSLHKGDAFDAMSYIASYSQDQGTLILPVVDTQREGNQIAVYRLESKGRQITQVLHVKIID